MEQILSGRVREQEEITELSGTVAQTIKIFFVFGSTGVCTQGLILARQELYI
jgi:hypothetical protein